MTTLYCIDPRHGTPCPEPCDACPIECATSTYGVTEAEARAAFPGWQPPVDGWPVRLWGEGPDPSESEPGRGV